jgi:hypothetical protein
MHWRPAGRPYQTISVIDCQACRSYAIRVVSEAVHGILDEWLALSSKR